VGLDSGRGLLRHVHLQGGQTDEVAAMPGYTRGLACQGPYAFVGLSKIRETAVFGGLPIAEHQDQLRCGVGVIELATGRTVATLQFHSGVEEIFAVELLPGVRNPKLCGPTLAEEHDREIWIVPSKPEALASPPSKPEASASPPHQPDAPARDLDPSSLTLRVTMPGASAT
jgi:uncharacterized protein (TIGR03032 family)